FGNDVAYDFLPVDFIRHAYRRSLENSSVPQQYLIDLCRRDIDAAPDDQILGPARDANEPVRILDGEVTGLDAVGANALDRSIIQKISDCGVWSAGRHLAFDTRGAPIATGVHDSEFLMQRRNADGADA